MEELVHRFAYIPQAQQDEVLCSRLAGLKLRRVRVAPSLIADPDAGSGLFATRDIAAGEVVTLYPCDVLLSWPSEAQQGVGDVRVSLGPHAETMRLTEKEAFDPRSEVGAAAWRYVVRTGLTRSALANSTQIEDTACDPASTPTQPVKPLPVPTFFGLVGVYWDEEERHVGCRYGPHGERQREVLWSWDLGCGVCNGEHKCCQRWFHHWEPVRLPHRTGRAEGHRQGG